MQATIFQTIKINTSSRKNPLNGIDTESLKEVVALLETEFDTLRQIWRICDSAIRHHEDEQIEACQDDPDMTNIILNNTAGFWEKLSPAGEQIRQHAIDIELQYANPSLNELAYYANEATTIRNRLNSIANELCIHPAGILGKSKTPFNALSTESCFSI